MKRFIGSLGLSFLATPGMAQAASAPSFWNDPISDPRLPTYITIGMVFIVIFLVALVAVSTKSAIRTLSGNTPARKDIAPISFGYRKLILYGLTVILLGMVILYNGSGLFFTSANEPGNEIQIVEQNKNIQSAQGHEEDLVYDNNEAYIQNGRTVYITHCAACHNSEGQGGIGPNLTDMYWLHGGSVRDVYTIIKTGVADKGMIAWEKILTSGQMRDVAFYIKSIEGTNPPNPKEPQGVLWKESIVASASWNVKEN